MTSVTLELLIPIPYASVAIKITHFSFLLPATANAAAVKPLSQFERVE